MRKWLWLICLVLGSPSVWAVQLKPDNFAYGIRIDVPRSTAVAALSLPEQVYSNAYRPDLGDMRVFNADGEPVPHLIRYARTRSEDTPWQQLTFFPLPETAKAEEDGYRVYVRTGPDGAVVRVDLRSAPTASKPASNFLIDLSRIDRHLVRLRLAWQPGDTHLMAVFAVDASDDLIHWTTIQPRSAIADIRDGSHHPTRKWNRALGDTGSRPHRSGRPRAPVTVTQAAADASHPIVVGAGGRRAGDSRHGLEISWRAVERIS